MMFFFLGQFAFYTEPAKSLEQQLHVYDPVKQKEITYKKEEMETFARFVLLIGRYDNKSKITVTGRARLAIN